MQCGRWGIRINSLSRSGAHRPVTASASDCGVGAADKVEEIMQPKRPQTGFGELACGGHCQCQSCANSCRNRTAPVECISPRDAFKVRADCASQFGPRDLGRDLAYLGTDMPQQKMPGAKLKEYRDMLKAVIEANLISAPSFEKPSTAKMRALTLGSRFRPHGFRCL
jgi:hypothetical protein